MLPKIRVFVAALLAVLVATHARIKNEFPEEKIANHT